MHATHAGVVNGFSSPAPSKLARSRANGERGSHVEDITVMTQSPTPVCDKEKQFAPINTERILALVYVASREFGFFYIRGVWDG